MHTIYLVLTNTFHINKEKIHFHLFLNDVANLNENFN